MSVKVGAEVTAMSGATALPRRNGDLVFEAPWQGRAFGMALAVVECLGLSWSAFQRHLIAEIAGRPGASYYECWLAALERLVVEHGVATAAELEQAIAAVDPLTPRV